ncbi:hypothetical protein FRB94_002395 [Tulasnella sp. JGI-2019a]|nr:hypothetical protein FRB93_012605 [Tulasnella sp. JGI-2019a]KAG8986861.1 hypothetical protein FRB94_002395 [Tulasnella sp. JGI-2019a]
MFLDSRENRHLDQLVVILANKFLPFYEEWEPNEVRNNQKTHSALQLAHRLWSTLGMVEETQPSIWQVTQTQQRREVDSSNAGKARPMEPPATGTPPYVKHDPMLLYTSTPFPSLSPLLLLH